MKTRPHILITNDDGVQAAGIRQLWHALKDIADLTIVAPISEQSGVGLSITIRNPIHIHSLSLFDDTPAWSVSGTPADCVKMALNVILKSPPHLIVSGINRGSNAGRNVLYSGTVGGAIEGAMQEISSVAFSCWDYKEPDYALASTYIPGIIHHLLHHPLPHGTILNVNFPSKAKGIKGIKLTRQGKEYWKENPDMRHHPAEEHPYYWMGIRRAEFEEREESDISWLEKGYIAAVPVHIGELTDHQHLSAKKSVFESLYDQINLN